MKYLRQLMIILAICFIGQVLETVCFVPIPGTVIGMILFFLALYTGIIKVEMIEDVCNLLLSHMSFLFIPAGVGIMVSFNMLKGKWIYFIIIVFVSTIIVWFVTIFLVIFLRKVFSHE